MRRRRRRRQNTTHTASLIIILIPISHIYFYANFMNNKHEYHIALTTTTATVGGTSVTTESFSPSTSDTSYRLPEVNVLVFIRRICIRIKRQKSSHKMEMEGGYVFFPHSIANEFLKG